MNALVKKEIRLLLPACLVVLLLEIVLPWLGSEPDSGIAMAPVFFFFGMILLAVDPFGREFSLGTFSSLMSQPIERRQIWRTKITVLFVAAALIFAAYLASCGLRLLLALATHHSVWGANDIKIWRTNHIEGFHTAMIASVAIMFIALTGGLWTTLLFRQIAAAFWITFLAPAGLLMAIFFFLPDTLADNGHVVIPLLYSVAGIYVASGFWLAHWLFYRAQDAGWTGGVITFSRWRYFESGSKSSVSTRHRKPVVALIKKELQLQSISWFCAAALVALHIAIILMRIAHGSFERNSVASVTSEFFWAVWLIMPLIIGSTAVAEERRLGVTAGQFCQPASRQLQFAVKYFPAIFSGVLLGGFVPLLLEGIAAAVGAPNPDFRFLSPADGLGYVSPIPILGLALGLSLAAVYASTLAKSFLQAMGIAVVTIIGCVIFTSIAGNLRSLLGITWNPGLTILIAILTVLVMAPWLTYGNFKYVEEHGRLWRRNLFGLTGAVVFIFASSAALYNRAWEVFEPAEPAHGLAILSLANPPTLRNPGYDMLQVQLPDGRIWFDGLGYSGPKGVKRLWMALISPFPISSGPEQFMAGSNWVSATARGVNFVREGKEANPSGDNHVVGYLDTIGIKKDGTLWISNPKHGDWNGEDMNRFGDGTNWQQVVRSYPAVLLLKQDGTLWRWGTNRLDWSHWPQDWPTLRTGQLYQIGTNSNWKELSPTGNSLARKSDGSVWWLGMNDKNLEIQWRRETNLDQVSFQNLAIANEELASVRPDGTLWFGWWERRNGTNLESGLVRAGTETNWTVVALTWSRMVALRSDGSLWQWDRDYNRAFAVTVQQAPTRLGIHHDWVAITAVQGGVVSLAADGSVWFWPNRNSYEYQQTLVALPKQPEFLGNVFGQAK